MVEAYNGGMKPLYLSSKEEIVQRASLLLSDVEYVIEAHFEMTEKANESTLLADTLLFTSFLLTLVNLTGFFT